MSKPIKSYYKTAKSITNILVKLITSMYIGHKQHFMNVDEYTLGAHAVNV